MQLACRLGLVNAKLPPVFLCAHTHILTKDCLIVSERAKHDMSRICKVAAWIDFEFIFLSESVAGMKHGSSGTNCFPMKLPHHFSQNDNKSNHHYYICLYIYIFVYIYLCTYPNHIFTQSIQTRDEPASQPFWLEIPVSRVFILSLSVLSLSFYCSAYVTVYTLSSTKDKDCNLYRPSQLIIAVSHLVRNSGLVHRMHTC